VAGSRRSSGCRRARRCRGSTEMACSDRRPSSFGRRALCKRSRTCLPPRRSWCPCRARPCSSRSNNRRSWRRSFDTPSWARTRLASKRNPCSTRPPSCIRKSRSRTDLPKLLGSSTASRSCRHRPYKSTTLARTSCTCKPRSTVSRQCAPAVPSLRRTPECTRSPRADTPRSVTCSRRCLAGTYHRHRRSQRADSRRPEPS